MTDLSAETRSQVIDVYFNHLEHVDGDLFEYELDGSGTWISLSAHPYHGAWMGRIEGLENGRQYAVKVRAVSGGVGGTAAGPVNATSNAKVPGAPRDFKVTERGSRSLTVTWTAPVDDGGSAILKYQGTAEGDWLDLTPTVSGTTFTAVLDGLQPMTPYYPGVRAVNAVGPGQSSEPYATSTMPGSPPAPQNVTAEGADRSIVVHFDPPGFLGSGPLTGYEYSLDNGEWHTLSYRPDHGSLLGTIEGLTNGQTYAVRIRAVNGYGGGDAAGPVSATPNPRVPDGPRNLKYVAGNRSATVSFTAPYDGGSPIVAYQASIDGWRDLTGVSTSADGKVTGMLTGLEPLKGYSLAVRAVNAVGPGAMSTEVLFMMVEGTPNAPALAVTAGDATLRLTVTPGAWTGGTSTYQYSLSGGVWTDLPATAATTPTTLTGLINGQTYRVRVRAVNAWGDGEPSAPIDATPAAASSPSPSSPSPSSPSPSPSTSSTPTPSTSTPATTVPGAPSGLAATGGDTTAALTFSAPATTGGSAIVGYEASTDGGTSWAALTTTGTGPYQATITGLTNGTAYQVMVRALNAAGAGAASAPVSVTPQVFAAPNTRPEPPTGVSVTAGTAQLVVSWTASVSSGVTGYTATARPGGATCTTTTQTSCVIGGASDTSYTVSVVATSAEGDSEAATAATTASPGGIVAPPEAPEAGEVPLMTEDGEISDVSPGQGCVFVAPLYAPGSEVVAVVYSEPVVLGTAVADADGTATLEVTLPDDLAPGEHTIAAIGVDSNGDQRILTMSVTATAVPDATTTDPGTAAPPDDNAVAFLPRTGGTLFPIGLLMIIAGGALVLLTRRRRRTA